VLESEGAHGYDARADEYGDLIEKGILDPVKVVRTALLNATSISGLLLTTECAIVDKPKPKAPAPGGGGGGMGGMGGMGGLDDLD